MLNTCIQLGHDVSESSAELANQMQREMDTVHSVSCSVRVTRESVR